MSRANPPTPLVVIIIDGWGISFVEEGNAVYAATTPTMDKFARHYPSAALHAAGVEVGLPWGEVGNSETGHRNIGAGRVQYQALPLIDNAIKDGTFFENSVLLGAIEHAREHNSNLHLMGLVSPGGVHSHMRHLFALLDLCQRQQFTERVYIHMFTDGRDTPPQSAINYLTELRRAMDEHEVGAIASITGRLYAMDRNNNWDRIQATYDMLTGGPREAGAPDPRYGLEQSYKAGESDETIPPTAITSGGETIAPIANNDAVIFFNFRPDRARELTMAFVQPERTDLSAKPLENIYFATMAQYDETIPAPAAFINPTAPNALPEVISRAHLQQFHIAESEKYAHVTYYLSAGREKPFEGEERKVIQSSHTRNFAEQPRMQAQQITDVLIEHINQERHDVYFVNFANPDMVGHTGDFDATVAACAFIDHCIARIFEAAKNTGGAVLITADHGNAEEMMNPRTGEKEKDHSSNPVPLHYAYEPLRRKTPRSDAELQNLFSEPIGVLADVAPTVLDILNLDQPPEMTGVSLLDSLQ